MTGCGSARLEARGDRRHEQHGRLSKALRQTKIAPRIDLPLGYGRTDEQTFTRENQAALCNVALDEILATDILQEVLLVNLVAEDEEGEIEYEITRHELPKH